MSSSFEKQTPRILPAETPDTYGFFLVPNDADTLRLPVSQVELDFGFILNIDGMKYNMQQITCMKKCSNNHFPFTLKIQPEILLKKPALPLSHDDFCRSLGVMLLLKNWDVIPYFSIAPPKRVQITIGGQHIHRKSQTVRASDDLDAINC